MVHWPKSVAGYVLALTRAVIVVGGVVQLAILLSSHLLVLAFLVVVALTTGALIVWHRKAAAAHDLAVADAPSFGDVPRNVISARTYISQDLERESYGRPARGLGGSTAPGRSEWRAPLPNSSIPRHSPGDDEHRPPVRTDEHARERFRSNSIRTNLAALTDPHARLLGGDLLPHAASAWSVMPSGSMPSAHTLRSDRLPSSAMSSAVSLQAIDSATIRVEPSGLPPYRW
jgi:hypothetical protein